MQKGKVGAANTCSSLEIETSKAAWLDLSLNTFLVQGSFIKDITLCLFREKWLHPPRQCIYAPLLQEHILYKLWIVFELIWMDDVTGLSHIIWYGSAHCLLSPKYFHVLPHNQKPCSIRDLGKRVLSEQGECEWEHLLWVRLNISADKWPWISFIMKNY